MAILPYTKIELAPEVAKVLASINEHGLQAKSMLTAVGDYWTHYYRNLDPIAIATTGSVTAISKEYTRLLDMVKSSNILDVPYLQSSQFELLVINKEDVETVYDAEENIDHYFVPYAKVVDTRYLTSSLFESSVVLERDVHFDVVLGKGYRFYVDLFGDENITGYAYTVGEDTTKHILLWACDIALSSTVIYQRYGRFLYKPSIDSEKYKWVISALMRFYGQAKTIQSIQDVLNVIYGIPYTRFKDEVITKIYDVDENLNPADVKTDESYTCIETNKATYYTYEFADLNYKVGDVVPQFSLLATFNKAEDYITHPRWWEGAEVIDGMGNSARYSGIIFPNGVVSDPDSLSPDEKNELMDKVLKYNTIHLSIGISFQTYATYLNQIKEVMNIIGGGIPVYLFPLVDAYFIARFKDWIAGIDEQGKEHFTDDFADIQATMGFASRYDWGQYLIFDGSVAYYMEPELDHGRHATYKKITFDGDATFDGVDKHYGRYGNVIKHIGQYPYNTGYLYTHNNDREELRILKYGFRHEDAYPWRKINVVKHLCYSSSAIHDGKHQFGEAHEEQVDEVFDVAVCYAQSDVFGDVHDAVDFTNVTSRLSDTTGEVFDGSLCYGGHVAVSGYDESFVLRLAG